MNVLFVCMPFVPVRPALGASTLSSRLRELGVASQVFYPDLIYARMVGPDVYHTIAEGTPTQLLTGEWVF